MHVCDKSATKITETIMRLNSINSIELNEIVLRNITIIIMRVKDIVSILL